MEYNKEQFEDISCVEHYLVSFPVTSVVEVLRGHSLRGQTSQQVSVVNYIEELLQFVG